MLSKLQTRIRANRLGAMAILAFLAFSSAAQDESNRELNRQLLDLKGEILDALRRLERNQTVAAREELLDAQRSPYYALLDSGYHDMVDRALLSVASATDDLGGRYADLLRFSQTSNNPLVFIDVIKTAQSLDNQVHLIRHIVAFIERWPERLPSIGDSPVAAALDAAYDRPDLPVSFEELASKLSIAALAAGDLGFISQCWRQFALRNIERGRPSVAARALENTLSVDVLVTMLIDIRFDSIRQSSLDATDLNLVMERELEWKKSFLAGNPKRIEAVRELASSLRRADRLDEALQLIDAAIEKILAPGANHDAWIDLQEQFSWLINDRASVLLELGRVQESVDQLMAAAELPERGQRNVSQTINYAARLLDLNRLDDAEKALSRVGRMSELGEMTRDLIRLGIEVQRGEERKIRKLAEKIERYESISPSRLQYAYLVLGDLDAAAAILIERLRDEDQRLGALFGLQHSVQTWERSGAPEYVRLLESRLESLRGRPDVRATVDEVGRILTFPFRL